MTIIFRLLVGTIISLLIGYDRRTKNSTAGLKTYPLVCLGSMIFTIISISSVFTVINLLPENDSLKEIISIDPNRTISQIVTGVGFLGAGTIIVTKKGVVGLSTASSLWAVASLGCAIGMGNYLVAILGCIIILVILNLFDDIPLKKRDLRIIIKFERKDVVELVNDIFKKNNIIVSSVKSKYVNGNTKEFTCIFNLTVSNQVTELDIISLLIDIEGINFIEPVDF